VRRDYRYKREELIGKNFLELNILPEKSLNKAIELLQLNMEGKSTGPDEIELISKEGRLIPVEINTSVVQRGGEGIVLAFVRDITERKRTELALRESEDRYRSLYVDSADSIMVFSPDQGFIAANPATIKLFACRDEQDFTTDSPASLSPEYQPDGVRSMDKSHEMIRLALEKGSHFFEWMHRRADGTDFPATVLLSRLESGSAHQLLQATVRDITELKRAGRRCDRAMSSIACWPIISHDVIFVLDMNLNYTYISPFRKKPEGI